MIDRGCTEEGGLMFRDVRAGDMMPDRGGQLDAQYWPRVLRWFCPSLTEEESQRLYQRAPRGVMVTREFLKALVLDNIAELRASPMNDPKSITELKPGSNYLIVYNRGDMPKEGVAALSEELLSLAGTLGASCTLVVVPDGCSMKVSEVPSPAEVLGLLRSVEWEGSDHYDMCPRCKRDRDRATPPTAPSTR